MNARIHSNETDWEQMHEELLQTAHRKAENLRDRVQILRKDLQNLRVRLPEEAQDEVKGLEELKTVTPFLDSWQPEAPKEDMGAWRDLHDQLLEGARQEIIALEDAVKSMESEIRDLSSRHSLA